MAGLLASTPRGPISPGLSVVQASRVLRFRVLGFRGLGVQGFRGSGVQGFMGSGVQGFRGSGVQGLGSGFRVVYKVRVWGTDSRLKVAGATRRPPLSVVLATVKGLRT